MFPRSSMRFATLCHLTLAFGLFVAPLSARPGLGDDESSAPSAGQKSAPTKPAPARPVEAFASTIEQTPPIDQEKVETAIGMGQLATVLNKDFLFRGSSTREAWQKIFGVIIEHPGVLPLFTGAQHLTYTPEECAEAKRQGYRDGYAVKDGKRCLRDRVPLGLFEVMWSKTDIFDPHFPQWRDFWPQMLPETLEDLYRGYLPIYRILREGDVSWSDIQGYFDISSGPSSEAQAHEALAPVIALCKEIVENAILRCTEGAEADEPCPCCSYVRGGLGDGGFVPLQDVPPTVSGALYSVAWVQYVALNPHVQKRYLPQTLYRDPNAGSPPKFSVHLIHSGEYVVRKLPDVIRALRDETVKRILGAHTPPEKVEYKNLPMEFK